MPPPTEILADEELARRAQATGSLEAFEELVRRHQAPLAHFLSRRFPSRRDIDDILQETFLKAWQSLHLYNPARSFRTWIYTIAYRIAVSHGRRDRPAAALPSALASPNPAPHAPAQELDDRLALWRAARALLSEDQFAALWLSYVDDLPAREIARILDCTWVNVKTLLHRARKTLKAHLGQNSAAPLAAQRIARHSSVLPSLAIASQSAQTPQSIAGAP